ncbi:MAG: hypothetical protein B7Z08_00020 [Sphingomonadales bacterium 32-68-7]|nr:MAG: hypothetical protein B7Z33_08335 [Sphingomonadales bacterium 12-68-11]OYX10620.1 MAG: hypothetical protein B7Z08_00020 [Sphingomonadales bacterium 32-68-7]
MALDLAHLVSTPDIRCLPRHQAVLVGAFRYMHLAQAARRYSRQEFALVLGSPKAVAPFHVFASAIGRAWPEPIQLNPPCQPRLSYDEMLILDLAAAAVNGDRKAFDWFVAEMLPAPARYLLWEAVRRFMGRFLAAA